MQQDKIIILYVIVTITATIAAVIYAWYPAIKTAWKQHLLTCDSVLPSNI